jgi:hypothetical protein
MERTEQTLRERSSKHGEGLRGVEYQEARLRAVAAASQTELPAGKALRGPGGRVGDDSKREAETPFETTAGDHRLSRHATRSARFRYRSPGRHKSAVWCPPRIAGVWPWWWLFR